MKATTPVLSAAAAPAAPPSILTAADGSFGSAPTGLDGEVELSSAMKPVERAARPTRIPTRVGGGGGVGILYQGPPSSSPSLSQTMVSARPNDGLRPTSRLDNPRPETAAPPLQPVLDLPLLAPILISGAISSAPDVGALDGSSLRAPSSVSDASSSRQSTAAEQLAEVASEMIRRDVPNAAAVVASDLAALSLRTGLPLKYVKRTVMRARRRHRRRQMTEEKLQQEGGQNSAHLDNRGLSRPLSAAPAAIRERGASSRRLRPLRQSVATLPMQAAPCGLRNYGQTCFLNSVLQALASLRPFLAYLETIVDDRQRRDELEACLVGVGVGGRGAKGGSDGGTMMSEILLDLLVGVNGGGSVCSRGQPDARDLLRRVGTEHAQFRARHGGGAVVHVGTEQQDAQELLQALVGMVVDESELEGAAASASFAALEPSGGPSHPLLDGESVSVVSACSASLDEGGVDENRLGEAAEDLVETIRCGSGGQSEEDHVLTLSSLLLRMDSEQKRMEEESVSKSAMSSSVYSGNGHSSCSSLSRKEEKKEEEEEIRFSLESKEKQEKDSRVNGPQGDKRDGGFEGGAKLHVHSAQNQSPDSEGRGPATSTQTMLKSLSSISPSPLTGWIGSTLQCCVCSHIRPIQNAPFLEIPIVPTSIAHSGSSGGCASRLNPSSPLPSCSLSQCLKNFTSMERVSDVECRACAIKAELGHVEDEMMMLRGAIDNISSRRKSKDRSKGGEDVRGLFRELQVLESRYTHLTSIDADEDEGNMIDNDEAVEVADSERVIWPSSVRGDANKCLLLTRLPTVLCFHIQRRYYDPVSNRMAKAMQIVEFPDTLDLGKHTAYGRPGPPSLAGTDVRGDASGKINPIPYKLMSVIEHRGNAHAGHYQTYRRLESPTGDRRREWALVSDEKVTYLSWNDVRNSQAYMLFYEAM